MPKDDGKEPEQPHKTEKSGKIGKIRLKNPLSGKRENCLELDAMRVDALRLPAVTTDYFEDLPTMLSALRFSDLEAWFLICWIEEGLTVREIAMQLGDKRAARRIRDGVERRIRELREEAAEVEKKSGRKRKSPWFWP